MATQCQSVEEMNLVEGARLCTGAVVYEDTPARDAAIALGKSLARRFEGDLEFEFTWWRFKYLGDSEIARLAAQAAVQADLVILSVRNMNAVTTELAPWFDLWITQRARSEGALVVLRQPAAERDWMPLENSYFEALAQRANMDYLPLGIPGGKSHPVDRLREDQALPGVTGLYQFSGPQYHSSGWGIDE